MVSQGSHPRPAYGKFAFPRRMRTNELCRCSSGPIWPWGRPMTSRKTPRRGGGAFRPGGAALFPPGHQTLATRREEQKPMAYRLPDARVSGRTSGPASSPLTMASLFGNERYCEASRPEHCLGTDELCPLGDSHARPQDRLLREVGWIAVGIPPRLPRLVRLHR